MDTELNDTEKNPTESTTVDKHDPESSGPDAEVSAEAEDILNQMVDQVDELAKIVDDAQDTDRQADSQQPVDATAESTDAGGESESSEADSSVHEAHAQVAEPGGDPEEELPFTDLADDSALAKLADEEVAAAVSAASGPSDSADQEIDHVVDEGRDVLADHQMSDPDAWSNDEPTPVAVVGNDDRQTTFASDPNRHGAYSELLVAHHDRGGMITERYRALRTSLLANCQDGQFCYMLTSAEPGEGKSVTGVNLAMVLTECLDRRTILVDCNLRNATMSKLLSATAVPGLAEVLADKAELDEAVHATAYPNLSIIPAGRADRSQVAELLGRPKLPKIVNQLKEDYDYLLFDAPAIGSVSDAGIVGRTTGQAMLVVRMNRTHRRAVQQAVSHLDAINVKLGAVVLTGQRQLAPNYLERYLWA